MGWRAWDAYETAAHERWRALPWQQRYGLRYIAALAILAMLAAGVLYAAVARAAPIDSQDVWVIDADTIRLHNKRPDVRLVGCNAPETSRARCKAESELGTKATMRAQELVRGGKLDFDYVACACKPGTEGTKACNLGRRCGTLKADGRDVCQILIAEKLAEPLKCGETRCPPMPRPWCSKSNN